MRWMTNHRGIFEQPAGSNRDDRKDGIMAAQRRLAAWLIALAWCGTWVANALLAAGVAGVSYRLASVSLIEDDARAKRGPFRDWLAPTVANLRRCLRGDLAVLFGRGVHVAMIRSFKYVRRVGWVIVTEEGNTSYGNEGSQSNGGVSCRRERPLSQVHGLARVDFPGGRARRAAGLVGILVRSAGSQLVGSMFGHNVSSATSAATPSSDELLLGELLDLMNRHDVRLRGHGGAPYALAEAMRRAGVMV